MKILSLSIFYVSFLAPNLIAFNAFGWLAETKCKESSIFRLRLWEFGWYILFCYLLVDISLLNLIWFEYKKTARLLLVSVLLKSSYRKSILYQSILYLSCSPAPALPPFFLWTSTNCYSSIFISILPFNITETIVVIIDVINELKKKKKHLDLLSDTFCSCESYIITCLGYITFGHIWKISGSLLLLSSTYWLFSLCKN